MERQRHAGPATRVLVAMLSVLVLASCAPPPLPIFGVRTQRDGRPTLRRLSWGYTYVDFGAWSPDGQWIALVAGSDNPSSHLAVVSADGRTRHGLSSWDCGTSDEFDVIWSPDGRLGCLGEHDRTPGVMRLCVGTPPAFDACQDVAVPQIVGRGGMGSTWAPDGQTLWIAAIHNLPPDDASHNPDLFVLMAATGALEQVFSFTDYVWDHPSTDRGGIYLPQWVPQQQALSYEVGLADIDGPGLLVMSAVTRDTDGQFVLGPRTVLASGQVQDGYAWSPSGHWVAVRIGGDQGNDHIALVNADDPSQTVDVTNERDVGQWLDPVWSPDGKTLIIINTDDDQPYAIDIASYLASKGLQP